MSHSYTSSYPPLDLDPSFKSFFESFYKTSDTPDAHDEYVTHFTKDATLIMASKKAQGSEGASHYPPSTFPPSSQSLPLQPSFQSSSHAHHHY
jgi:hypothetical protein